MKTLYIAVAILGGLFPGMLKIAINHNQTRLHD
jgi:hypothetical protein